MFDNGLCLGVTNGFWGYSMHDGLIIHIAAVLREFRVAKNLSQSELAELAGSAQSIISNFEGGKKQDFYFSLLIDICHALNVDTAMVISMAEERSGTKLGDNLKRKSPDDIRLIDTINKLKTIKPKYRKALLDHIQFVVDLARKDN